MTNDGYKVVEGGERALKKFLSYFGDTVTYRQQGLPDEEIARIYAEGMLIDMRNTFHGTADFARFNEGLYDAVLKQFNALKVRGEVRGQLEGKGLKATFANDRRDLWEKAAASIDIDKFDDLTKNFKVDGFINTRIEFQGFTDFENVYRRYGNKAMELMDRQLTSILRQPLVQMTYVKYRKAYSG